ncbi:putative domain NUC173 [Dillenia turbinata]|uniref:Domain NUC173 n=1 Tax=Dillenia turbinata TaxID=194707 RepID=A0AAN8W3W8_9MAGN
MEGLEFEDRTFAVDETEDFCNSILSRYGESTQEDHQRLCAAIGAISQELKEQNLPLTPVAYFGATTSSLSRLSAGAECPANAVDALLTVLSLLLPQISVAILKKKREYLSSLIIGLLRLNSLSPSGIASGIRCISHLMIATDKASWSDLSQLYGVLLGFITDSQPKVRRQAHLSLHDVLQSFQNSSVLEPASVGIMNVFERFLLLAGGSNATTSEGPKGAQNVLYVLDGLKDCLPLMSLKSATSTLKYFKALLELRQPLVTRRLTNCLNVICLHPTLDVSPEALLDLLCLLAHLVSSNETSPDSMTFTARLLDAGMRKIYSLNREICAAKLPIVFNALTDVMALEHEEAIYAAAEALKSLICSCMDESLVKQGVDQIRTNGMDVGRSGPTVIEKVCASIESLLDYRYAAVWDTSFQVVSTMFDALGENSAYLLRTTLKSLAEMQKLPDEDIPYRKQLHDCVGSALGAMGPETFLSLLPLKLEAEDPSEANIWLFPILRQYIVGARLSFFTESILSMIGPIKQKSRKLESEGRIFSSRSADGLIYSLWSLLPSFCNYPSDTSESFKTLSRQLCRALHEEPDLRGIICSSLQILVQQNKRLLAGENDICSIEESIPKQRAMSHYTLQVATDNLAVLRSSAKEIFSTLSGTFLKSKDAGGSLQPTIGEFASISDKAVVKRIFKTTMQKLLMATQESVKAKKSGSSSSMQIDNSSGESSPVLLRAKLFDLAVSFLPGLDPEEINLLVVAIKPALEDDDGLVQKKAYKALSVILKDCHEFVSTKLDELLQLMIEMLPLCHFSAKRHRLDCLYFLIVYMPKDESEQRKCDIISSFLTEIILSLKEANKKTRNRAYDLLVQIGHAYGDEERGGKKEFLYQYFNMIAGGLAGETPHMISAAVKGLARLSYEFSELISAAFNVLPSTFLLLQRKNREITKKFSLIMQANLGLLKVLVAKSQADGLQMHLKSMVEGLLKWQDNTKNHFKAKVKLLLEMLIRKCGLEAVKEVMPEEHMKLLTNIRKIKERKERKATSNSEESRSQQSKATTSRQSRWNHSRIFSDFDEEETRVSNHMDALTISGRRSATSQFGARVSSVRSKKLHRVTKSLPEDLFDQLEDDPLDLLDRKKTRSALQSLDHHKRKAESDDEPEIDPEGRLLVREEGKPKRESQSEFDMDTKSLADSYLSVNSSRRSKKRQRTSETGRAYTGSEYASKKAGGDVKKKDKLEPFAYWPLDRKMMSRRREHRAAARKGMASVARMTKRLEGKSASGLLRSHKIANKKR